MSDSKPHFYLDNFSTTKVHAEVSKKISEFELEHYGNPSSTSHSIGRNSSEQVDQARSKISEFIGCKPNEIVFTSGATESDNLAIIGVVNGLQPHTDRKTILISSIEHPAILESAESLISQGYKVEKIDSNEHGIIDIEELKSKLTDDVLLVSVMLVNNELGTIQPIKEISELAHSVQAIMHTDAAQALGKIPVDVGELEVDLMSMSSHKMYGPKGIGALFISGGPLNFPIEPLFFGGGQESELRPGTLNAPGIIGFASACSVAQKTMHESSKSLSIIRDAIETELKKNIPGLKINGHQSPRVPGGSNFTFDGVLGDPFIANLKRVIMSTGSACKSGAPTPSHVLLAIGLSREQAESTVRFCIDTSIKESDIEDIVNDIISAHEFVKSLS